MARNQIDEPSVPEINQGIMQMVQFYGSIVATPNIDSEISKKCNSMIARLLDQMDYDANDLIKLKIAACGKIKL